MIRIHPSPEGYQGDEVDEGFTGPVICGVPEPGWEKGDFGLTPSNMQTFMNSLIASRLIHACTVKPCSFL
jgi:hypothetical protein